MSYCRFSDDNFQCDVYAYSSEGGYVIHVAANRLVGNIPPLPDIFTTPSAEFVEAYRVHMDGLEHAIRERIELPHNGDTFVLGDLESMCDKLKELQALGYRVPAYVFDEIAEEILVRGVPK